MIFIWFRRAVYGYADEKKEPEANCGGS